MMAAARVLIGVVALLHAYFLVLEMFLWRTRAKRPKAVSRSCATP